MELFYILLSKELIKRIEYLIYQLITNAQIESTVTFIIILKIFVRVEHEEHEHNEEYKYINMRA